MFPPPPQDCYLICELNSTIEVLIYDGVGKQVQVISTLPEVALMVLRPFAVFLKMVPLYALNRGHDSMLSIVLADGSLELLEIPTHGKDPLLILIYHLTRSSSSLFLTRGSDNATVFKRNPETGESNEFQVP